MKTYKFRAWDVDANEWSELNWPFIEGYNLNDGLNNWGETFSLVFMQFTGLYDKNGKEIYEGDIVKDDIADWRWEVYFDADEAKFWCKNEKTNEGVLGQWNCSDDPAYPSWRKYEVIGNIYETPELLVSVQK